VALDLDPGASLANAIWADHGSASVATPAPTATPCPATPSPATPSPAPKTSGGPSLPPGATTSPEDAAIYSGIEADVQELRGLTSRAPVDPRLLDQAGVEAYIESSLAQIEVSQIESSDALLTALGLLPADLSLGDEFKKLFATQVAGFYEPETKELYVISKKGGLGPIEKVTFAHEYTHALQDQHFPEIGGDEFQGALSGIIRTPNGNSDRSLGVLGLVEGDPSLVMTYWAQQHLSPTELLALVAASSDPETTRILEEMPAILRETLLFPYTSGLQLVLGRQLSDGWAAIDALYANPPASTEQLLHPDKYPDDRPVTVELPDGLARSMGSGWKVAQEDTMGELQLRIWLEAAGGSAWRTQAATAAAGWGGDRIQLLQGPNGAWALALRTSWDTPPDAREFATGARAAIGALKLTGSVVAA
jgi:hypothetical protein